VNASVSGGNGTVDPAAQIVGSGYNASIDLTPDAGYHVATITDNSVSMPLANPYIISNVTANHIVVATFSDTYTIIASAGTGGSISPSGTITVNPGSNQTFNITPDNGYIVAAVLVDSVSQGRLGRYTFSDINAYHTISVSFEGGWYIPSTYSGVGFTNPTYGYSSNNAYASASVANQTVKYGTFNIPAIPAGAIINGIQVSLEGYRGDDANSFDIKVSKDGGIVFSSLKQTEDPGNSPDKTIMVGGPTDTWGWTWAYSHFTNANFKVSITVHNNGNIYLDCVKVKVFYSLTITASAGANGSISPSGEVTVSKGSDQTFNITPDSHYHVANVIVDSVSQGPLTSYTFYNVTTNHTISASFAIDIFHITGSAGSGGSISPTEAYVAYGASQTFTFTPNSGYFYADVLVDDVSQGRSDRYTFNNVSASHTISVSFETGWYSPSNWANYSGITYPENALSSNNSYASASASGANVAYYTFLIPSIPPEATINGIQISLEGYRGGTANSFDVFLSWNAGSSYTELRNSGDPGTLQDKIVIPGGPTDTWGRTWSYSDFTNANFRIKIVLHNNGITYLDSIKVKVSYSQ
jgi:hypothetical protein